jgi:hypothetical protein
MLMKLKPRNGGPDEFKDIASFREEGRGLRVFDRDGNDVGYFGPEDYQTIILGGAEARERAPEDEPSRRRR